MQTSHDDHDDVVGRGEIDIVHDQHLVVSEARLAADVGLPRGFGASLVLPLRLVSTTIEYFDTAGTAVELTAPGIHHRNETVAGLGDPMVLGWYGRRVGEWRVTGRVGLTVPLGRTEEDPFALGDQGLAHQHIQMGTGTVNPVLAVEAGRGWGPWSLGGFGFTQQIVYANGKGYQGGDRYAAGLTLRRGLGVRWTVRGGAEVQAERAERWNGVVRLDDGNRGRFDAIAAAGASWAATPSVTVDLGVKVPVVTRVVGGQLAMPAIVEVGASWSFGGPAVEAHDDEHDHDGHDEHDHDGHDEHDHDGHDEHDHEEDRGGGDAAVPHVDTTGLDVADLPEPAAGEAMVPVPGKVTIVDVWATWCQPCKVLEPMLIELVRAQPDRLALRRIDVSTSERWTVTLPHVRVFDATGAKVLELSSDGNLDALVNAVRGAVRAALAPRPATPRPAPRPPTASPRLPAAVPRFSIMVTAAGFAPDSITVPRGRPVVLVFERQTDRTCATEVVMTVAGKRIEQKLPLQQRVALTLTFPSVGTITYACAMDMIRGTITVK